MVARLPGVLNHFAAALSNVLLLLPSVCRLVVFYLEYFEGRLSHNSPHYQHLSQLYHFKCTTMYRISIILIDQYSIASLLFLSLEPFPHHNTMISLVFLNIVAASITECVTSTAWAFGRYHVRPDGVT
jgi:hypothetical protein